MGSNYKKWKRNIEFAIGLIDLDICLLEGKMVVPTGENTVLSSNEKVGKDASPQLTDYQEAGF